MRKSAITIFFATVSLVLHGQGKPAWLDDDFRKRGFPENAYITGFAYGNPTDGKTLQETAGQMKTEAEADLSKKILAKITSTTTSDVSAASVNGRYIENEIFTNRSVTESAAEVTGINTESYYDPPTGMVYAFAYVKRDDLAGYYKSRLALYIAQAEGTLQTARDLEANDEKVKARGQCEAAAHLLLRIRFAQEMLTAIDPNTSPDDLQQTVAESVHHRLAQMQARLAQAVLVFVESRETNFSKPSTVLTHQVKAELAQKGCSFVDDAQQADFCLYIEATTRHYASDRGFETCYADVKINLAEVRKNKSVFQDEFSQKGVTASQETAGRKALEDAATTVVSKIAQWIANN